MPRKAFTLIELLVVIAIISLLAAILFPVFSSAREKARQIMCASNLKQIGMASLMYEGDYDETVLPYYVGAGTPGKYITWWGTEDTSMTPSAYTLNSGLLQPYMRSSPIEACPDLSSLGGSSIGLTGYGYNTDYLSPILPRQTDPAGDIVLHPVTLAAITAPTMTVLLADSGQLNGSAIKADPWLDSPVNANSYPNFHGIHQGFGNVCWVDGHVKAMPVDYDAIVSVSTKGVEKYGSLSQSFKQTNLGNLDLVNRPAGQPVSDELFNLTGSP